MTRNRYKLQLERQAATTRQLRKQLAAERLMNSALSGLAFVPQGQQDPERIRQLRRATTVKRRLMEGRAAA